jgi:palmitoyltransferase ZDHHC4
MLVLVSITPPYLLIYAATTSDSAIITPANHEMNMHLYPYDYAIFHPGNTCRTCHLLKPARSKHCGICKTCVARQDHHCIWLNNCVGRTNYGHFLNLLLSLTLMLMYGAYLGYGMLDQSIQFQFERWSPPGASKAHWSTGEDWRTYFQLWSLAITDDVRVGGVTLLSLLSAPITFGLLAYHIYLIWAGMTTNESVKWADWRDDIADGVVFKEKRTALLAAGLMHAHTTPKVDWPISTDQVLVRTEDGHPPGSNRRNGVGAEALAKSNNAVAWKKVKRLEEVDNLYDLGFWDNIIHSFRG